MNYIDQSDVRDWFENDRFLTTDELVKRLSLRFPDAKTGTLSAKLHRLKREGLVRNVRRGLYAAGSKREFEPDISKQLAGLFKKLGKRFPYLDSLCVWDSRWLNEFTVHQALTSMVIIETERDAEKAVFEFIKAAYSRVFIDPTPKEIDNYILGCEKCFVVRPIVTEAPVTSFDNAAIPRLEKILVDLVCEKDLFVSFQGEELCNIFRRALTDYDVSLSTLRRYARRRGRLEEIDKLIVTQGEGI